MAVLIDVDKTYIQINTSIISYIVSSQWNQIWNDPLSTHNISFCEKKKYPYFMVEKISYLECKLSYTVNQSVSFAKSLFLKKMW